MPTRCAPPSNGLQGVTMAEDKELTPEQRKAVEECMKLALEHSSACVHQSLNLAGPLAVDMAEADLRAALERLARGSSQILEPTFDNIDPLIGDLKVEHTEDGSAIMSAQALYDFAVAVYQRLALGAISQSGSPRIGQKVTLSGNQLRRALRFVNPDEKDADQLETEVCIAWIDDRSYPPPIEGEPQESPGYRVWLAEYPEEGSVPLGEQ